MMLEALRENWPYIAGVAAYAVFTGFRGYVKSRADADPEVNGWDHLSAALKNVVWPFSKPRG